MTASPELCRYEAFISYRHAEADRRVAERLHGFLETYRVPAALVAQGAPARISRIFRDREELPTSSELGADIQAALQASLFLIVICSPRTPASAWVTKEVETFIRLGRAQRILTQLSHRCRPDGRRIAEICGFQKSPPICGAKNGRRSEELFVLTGSTTVCSHSSSRNAFRSAGRQKSSLYADFRSGTPPTNPGRCGA